MNKLSLFPIFKSSVTEKINRIADRDQKVYLLEFFSSQRPDGDWELEYRRELDRKELDRMSVTKMVAVLKENYYRFRDLAHSRVVMFMVDGLMFSAPVFDSTKKVLTGRIANRDIMRFIDSTDEVNFDLIEMFDSEHARVHFFFEDDAVVLGDFVYLNGKVECLDCDPTDIPTMKDWFKYRRLFHGESLVDT